MSNVLFGITLSIKLIELWGVDIPVAFEECQSFLCMASCISDSFPIFLQVEPLLHLQLSFEYPLQSLILKMSLSFLPHRHHLWKILWKILPCLSLHQTLDR